MRRLSMKSVTDTLHSSGITTLDAELLLAHILRKDRAWLLAHGETTLTEEQKKRYDDLIKRRKNHEPIAYILGEKEFYGRSFSVDRRVLIPRPSTEALIDEVKNLLQTPAGRSSQRSEGWSKPSNFQTFPRITKADNGIVILTWIKPEFSIFNFPRPPTSGRAFSIIDIGTGSGCIAITLAKEIPDITIIATDISKDALEVAKMNAERHGVLDRVEFIEADGLPRNILRYAKSVLSLDTILLRSARKITRDDTPFLLISNPPYIPQGDQLSPDVSLYEPHTALIAGPDGMDVLTPLIQAAKEHPFCIGFVVEMMQSQCTRLLGTLHG